MRDADRSTHDRPRDRRAVAWTILLVATLAAAALTPIASAAEPPVPGDPPAPADGEILIRYAPGTTAGERGEIARGQRLTRVRTSADGRTDVVVARGRSTSTIRRELAADPRVVAIAENQQRQLADDVSAEPSFAQQWALDNTGQTLSGTTSESGVANVDIDGLQALAEGLGSPDVVVAIVDDGVDLSHPDLIDRAWINPGESGAKATNGIDDDGNGYVDDVNGWDFCNDDNTVHDAGADGHGTHVAGTVAASLNGQGTVGVAPGVSIMALKFIDDGWSCGRDDMAVEAIDYAASFGVRIINASWGGPQPSSVLDAAIGDSHALVVAAAGNNGVDLDRPAGPRFYPASSTLANIIAVSAVDQSGRLAWFSNSGSRTVDLAAPGTNILSTYPADLDCPSPCYAWSAGTSMAAPHVSGVAALVGSLHPSLLAAPTSMRSHLMATGRRLDGVVGKTVTGRMVNAWLAIDATAPVVRAPNRFGFGIGSIIGSHSVKTYIRWPSATDTMTGISGYDVRRLGPEGWTDVARGVVTPMVTTSLSYDSAYTFRLRATDGAGNVGGPADSPPVTLTLHPDSTSLATYGPGWMTGPNPGATGGSLHSSYKGGSWMSFALTGRSVALVSPRGPTRGAVKVYVDGKYAITVSLTRSTNQATVVVFARSWPVSGTHTVKLVVVGTAGHSRVDVDGFVVIH